MKKVAAVLVAALALPVVVLAGGVIGSQPDPNLCAPVGTPAEGVTVAASDMLPGLAPDPATRAQQWANAAAIVRQGRTDGVPGRGLQIGLMTARQESTLINVGHGDLAGPDSTGLFQQRAPWGPRDVRMNPAGAAHLFFTGGLGGQRGLLDVPGWQTMPLTRAAQAVQVSAFPDAYARWETLAAAMLAKLGVTDIQPVDCGDVIPASFGTRKDCPPPAARARYGNGQIPASALCPLKSAPGHMLRSDAAVSFDAMSGAYRARFGRPICVTDSYRDLATQIRLRAEKPTLAAVPGTSNHGWGTAVDACGGIQDFGTAQHVWVCAEGPRYGWQCPPWARAGGSKPEPWHIEYGH